MKTRYFSTTRSVGKVIVEKKIPPPCIQTPQKNPVNFREMLGSILRVALMKEKEEQLFNGQWLKRTGCTTCAAGMSGGLCQASLKAGLAPACWMNEEGGLIIWMGKKPPTSETICTFGLKSTDFRWLGDQNCLPRPTCCSRCGLCASSWRGGMRESWCEGHLLLALIRPTCRMCFYCTRLFLPQRGLAGTVRDGLWCKAFTAKCCSCSMCVCASLCSATWVVAPCVPWVSADGKNTAVGVLARREWTPESCIQRRSFNLK